jgi:C4-dicarboxylate transporter
MSTTDYIIPALALGLILIEVFLDYSPKFKKFALIGIVVLTFGFSFWAAWQNTSDIKELKDHANLILVGRRTDSINNAFAAVGIT